MNDGLKACEEKMRDAGVPDAAIATFAHYYEQLESGETGMLPDADLDQLSDVPSYDDLPDEADAEALALGALLAGYVIDSTGYGLHHVLSQTLVRLAGASHGKANAVLLCHTIGALAWRFPERIGALGIALEDDPADVAARMCGLVGATRLRDIGVEREALAECATAAAERPELDLTPPRADRAELLALYEGAW